MIYPGQFLKLLWYKTKVMKQPYRISIDPSVIDDLRHRRATTRWTNNVNILVSLAGWLIRLFAFIIKQSKCNAVSAPFLSKCDGASQIL
jgi:hypothetical protein